jgi:hypothetical protein
MLFRRGDTCHKTHKTGDLTRLERGCPGHQEEQVIDPLLEQEGDSQVVNIYR